MTKEIKGAVFSTNKKECTVTFLNGKEKTVKCSDTSLLQNANGQRILRIYSWPTGNPLTSDREDIFDLWLD